jgi:hypothetical protein
MRFILRAFLFVVAAVAAISSSAAAQREVPASGRVRITARGWQPARATGTLMRVTDDSVMVRTGDSLVAFPRERVTRVEVPDGRRTYVGPGILIGIGVGAAIGAIGGITCHDDCPDGTTALTTGIGAGGGMLLGAGIGALVRGDRWRDYAEMPPVALTLAPAPHRRGIALTMRIATR